MKKKVYLSFSLLLLLSFLSYSQNEKLGIRIEDRGAASLNVPSPDLDDEVQVGRLELGINASFKKKIDKQKLGLTTLTIGAEYRYNNLTYDDLVLAPNNNLVRDLHMLRLQVDYMKVFKQKWILSVFLRPGIFSDFEDISIEHFRLEGAALLDYRKSKQTLLGFGVARSANFGRLLILPVFHYYHRKPKFEVDILLPSRASIGWIQKKWYYGFSIDVKGSQYRLGSTLNGFEGKNTIGVSDITMGPLIKYNVGKKSYFLLTGGATAVRRWEFRNDDLDRDDRLLQDFDPDLTWFVRTGFVIRH